MYVDNSKKQKQRMNCTNDVLKLQELLQLMRTDNDLYRKNFDKLKLEYIELQNFYNEQHLRWRSQLESKTAEFEVLRKQMDRESQEVEAMKVKLVEELEIRQRLEKDIAESDKFRNMYNDLRRTFELAKSDQSLQVEALQKQMNEMRSEKDVKIVELQEKLQEAKRMMSTHKHAETVRALEKENEQLNIKAKQLLNELNDVREEKSKVLAQKEQASIIQSQQYAQLITKGQSLESENERYRKKILRMTEEIEDFGRQSNRMHDTIIKLEKEVVQLKHQLEEQQLSFNSERSTLKANCDQRDRESERERQSLRNQVSELNNRLESLQKQKQELQGQIMDARSELTEKTRKSLHETNEKYIKLESQRNSLQDQMLESERNYLSVQHQLKEEIQRLHKEVEILRTTCESASFERDEYREKFNLQQTQTIPQLMRDLETSQSQTNQQLEYQLSQLTAKYNSLKHKSNYQLLHQLSLITSKYNTLRDSSQNTISKYKDQKRKLQSHVEQLSLSYSRTKTQCDVQTKQIAKAEETISKLQNELWQEKQSSTRRTSQLERDVQKLQFMIDQKQSEMITSEPKLSESYKDMYSNTVKQIENIADRVSKFSDSRKDINK